MNYDFSNFHKVCNNRQLVLAPDGLHIVCLTCGVSANLEAISAKISPVDACKIGDSPSRMSTGDQSFNVNKGAVIQ